MDEISIEIEEDKRPFPSIRVSFTLCSETEFIDFIHRIAIDPNETLNNCEAYRNRLNKHPNQNFWELVQKFIQFSFLNRLFVGKKMKQEDRKFYAGVLRSEECFCGKFKKHGFAVCYKCYQLLPKDLQTALNRKIGVGFEEAYEETVKYLTENELVET